MLQLLLELDSYVDGRVLIPIKRLEQLREELEAFQREEELNGFQRWIMGELYQYELPKAGYDVQTILLIALSHPTYAEVELGWQGTEYKVKSLVMPDFENADARIEEHIRSGGYHCSPADNLPLKRLAVQSGLANYGRNNITYMEGLGSNVSYKAYYTDIPCEEDSWRPVTTSEACKNCKLCINNCPTGAIRPERFLIDNQRCLSALNEVPGEFPDWLPESTHHTMYDCLRCQEICPMNKEYKDDVLRSVRFSEEETGLLLEGAPFDTLSNSMRARIKLLGLENYLSALPRNLSILLKGELYKS